MRSIVSAAILAMVVAACGGGGSNKTTDPYKVYLRHAPADAPHLSRDDAQVRAQLGCGQKWAPGTVDAALQKAYKDYVHC